VGLLGYWKREKVKLGWEEEKWFCDFHLFQSIEIRRLPARAETPSPCPSRGCRDIYK